MMVLAFNLKQQSSIVNFYKNKKTTVIKIRLVNILGGVVFSLFCSWTLLTVFFILLFGYFMSIKGNLLQDQGTFPFPDFSS